MSTTNKPSTADVSTQTALPFQGTGAPEGTPLPPVEVRSFGPRFKNLNEIALGGQGAVYRVRDLHMERTVALKVLPAPFEKTLQEAQMGGRLQHPGIVPVYEAGHFDDGRGWLAMKLVEGHDLAELFSRIRHGQETSSRRRLITLLARVAEAMSYAHDEGVVHRDLKPANIRLGAHGEVLVLDWGIAGRVRGQGQAAGTPGYMAPEQWQGALIAPPADVHALGRILNEMLGLTSEDDADRALHTLCASACAPQPSQRPSSAAFAKALTDWLDGATRRMEARKMLAEARSIELRVGTLRAQARVLRQRATAVLGPLKLSAPVAEKAKGWALETEAETAHGTASRLELEMEQRLNAALRHAPELKEARRLLGTLYRRWILDAERRRAPVAAAEHSARLRALDPDEHAAFLAGDGQLTLHTEPSGAAVYLAPVSLKLRRLVPGEPRLLGHTPLTGVSVPRGRHQLRLEAAGRPAVRLPLWIEREAHLTGIAPGEDAPTPIVLPSEPLPDNECYVPTGWFQSGGDPVATDGAPARRVWVDGFVIERTPLTYRRLLPALNALVDTDQAGRARLIAPDTASDGDGFATLVCTEAGHYQLESADGLSDTLDWPVTKMTWHNAVAWAELVAEQTGQPWRLPHELEREKAARGVDGRTLPWGDYFEPTWACTVNARSTTMPASVHDFVEDEGPYGVRGMAGNVRDWCRNTYVSNDVSTSERLEIQSLPTDDRLRVVCGGAWGARTALCHSAGRFASGPSVGWFYVGVRLVRSLAHGDWTLQL
jgi:serine/threonine-protein kinase